MVRHLKAIVGAVVLTVTCASAGAISGSFKLEASEDRATLTSDAAPLGDILAAIANQTKIRVYLPSSLKSQEVTVSFEGAPWASAFRKLLAGLSYSLVQEPSSTEEMGALLEVHVLSTGNATTSAPLPPTPVPVRVTPSTTKAGSIDLSEEEDIGLLGDLALQGEDPSVRMAALEALGEWTDEDDARRAISRALVDAERAVRAAALQVIKSNGPAEFPVEPIANVALNDEDAGLRIDALQVLAFYFNDDTTIEILRRVHSSDPNPAVSQRAADLLQNLGASVQ